MSDTKQKPLDQAPLRTLVEWVADCASWHLHLWEDLYPNDPRPRQAIETLRSAAPYAELCDALETSAVYSFWQDHEADGASARCDEMEAALVAQGFAPFREVQQKLQGAADAAKQAADDLRGAARNEKLQEIARDVARAISQAAGILTGGNLRACVHNALVSFRHVVLLAGGSKEEEDQRQQKRLIEMIQATKEPNQGSQDGNAPR